MGKRLWVIFAIGVAVLSAPVHSSAATAYLRTDEMRSVQLVNQSRAEHFARALVELPALDAIARAQAVRMVARGEIYHNPHLGADATAAGIAWVRLGENVGVGPDVKVIHDAFLASPHHRDNMLYAPYNAIGVGIAAGTGDRSGMMFVAHVFGQIASALTPVVPAPHAGAAPAPVTRVVRPVAAAATPSPRPVTVTRPRPSSSPNALVGGVVDHTALIGIALPA